MARPRTITDERLLTAAGVAISRLGPAFTLADVAREAGVAAGTLVQRFGSKHGLLVAMTRAAIDGLRAGVATPGADAAAPADRAAPGDPVDAVVDAVVAVYAPLDDPDTAANNLAQLAYDLADAELRGLMADFHAAMEAGLCPLLERAIAAGALGGAPPPAVAARILSAAADGTAMHWSARPEGGLSDRLRGDLTAITDGWPHGRRSPIRDGESG